MGKGARRGSGCRPKPLGGCAGDRAGDADDAERCCDNAVCRTDDRGSVGRDRQKRAAGQSMSSATAAATVVEYDALKDKSYRRARSGADVAAFLAWMDLGGASSITVDNYERALA